MKIPLHSICVNFGKDITFPEASLNAAKIYHELNNRHHRTGLEAIATDDLINRIGIGLRLGERIFVNAESIEAKQRHQFIERLLTFGAPIYNCCINDDLVSYRGTENIDVNAMNLVQHNVEDDLSTRFNGITVVGDVHGMLTPLKSAIAWAQSRNHYMVFVGDILDYGPDSLAAIDEVYKLVMNGNAMLITGNHERKIMRWMDGYRVKLSDGNRVTTMDIMGLSPAARSTWGGRFSALYQRSRVIQSIGNLTFAHAAVAPSYWATGQVTENVEHMAFFGEMATRSGESVSMYNWIDHIPSGHTAIVGHNIRSRAHPVSFKNKKDGTALFLDTGSGKGGRLSSACFRFEKTIKLKNFNIY